MCLLEDLKKYKCKITLLQLKDPDDPSKIISDPKEIKKILTSYCKNLSKKPPTNNETLTNKNESYLNDQHDDTDMFNNIEINLEKLKPIYQK